MITLESISKTFPDGDLFNNVSLMIKHGMRAGLVGPNGSGKTTLLRIMLKQESPDSGNVQVEKSITIGFLAQEIVSGSNRSILEEVLAAYPEMQGLQRQLLTLSHKIGEIPPPGLLTVILYLEKISPLTMLFFATILLRIT